MTTAPAMGPSFDEVVLPHLDAAYRLACWLIRNEHDAEDAVQEASLGPFDFRTFTGGNGRAWFLRIVRNTCHGGAGTASHRPTDPFDEERHGSDGPACNSEALVMKADGVRFIERALSTDPIVFVNSWCFAS